MSPVWLTILALAVATFAIKAVGPVALGGRELPRRFVGFIALLAPSLLAALVAVQVFSGPDRTLVIDAKLAGVIAAGVALMLKRSMTVVVLAAAVATAAVRALT
jgi:branched-subunit amino acid transport protein